MSIPANHPDVLRALAEGRAVDTTPRPGVAATAGPKASPPVAAVARPSPWIRLTVGVPGLHTASEANSRGRRRDEIRRKGEVKAAVLAALPAVTTPLTLPLVVTLRRVGTGNKPLDDDNLRRAMKAVRDVVADWLGADDGDERIRWRYRQRRGWKPSVVIEIRTPSGQGR